MKGNKTITLWMHVAATTWLCWSSSTSMHGGRSSSVCSLTLEKNSNAPATNYDSLSFNLRSATSQSFTDFINKLRGSLKKFGDYQVHNIQILSSASSLGTTQRFVIVKLSNSDDTSIELGIDVSNVNIVGYRAGDRSYFFSDAPAEALNNVFKGTNEHKLPFGSSYADLERAAGIESRKDSIFIGGLYLNDAIDSLYDTDSTSQTDLAKHLIVVTQMIPDAARFKVIEVRVRESIDISGDYLPDGTMISLEDNWESLSRAVQESNDGGVFPKDVLLRTTYGSRRLVGNVIELRNALALMLFICHRSPSQFSPLIRSVVPYINDNVVDCKIPEPTVRISGRNGLCVEVQNRQYRDGSPVQLAPCKFEDDVKQLWTLEEDGMISSNGKCLATSEDVALRQDIVIYDCRGADYGRIHWKVWRNGIIVNTKSGYVLAATAGESGTILTLEENTYACSQAWLASNNIDPLATTILGYKDLCLKENGNKVWLEKCSGDLDQQWYLYPDGSIRPYNDKNNCLTCKNNSDGSVVEISSCSPASSCQRWVFENDGTILNLFNRLVLDVKGADPSSREIIIWKPNGNANQMWLAMP